MKTHRRYYDFTIESARRHSVGRSRTCEGVVGPVFIDRTVDSYKYLDMLTDVVVLQLRTRPDFAELYFQQDGAPSHYSLDHRDSWTRNSSTIGLDEGEIEWPPLSSDLTHMDFFWGVVTDYSRKNLHKTTVKELHQ